MSSEKSLTPQIRFKGFTEAWEQRKLDDITTRVSEMYNQPDLPRVEYEDINPGQGTLNKELSSKESTKSGIVFEPKDVLYGKLRPYLKNWIFPQFKGVAVGDFWVLRPTACDASFLFRFIQSERFWYYSNISSGSKMPRADWAFVSKGNYLVPKNREEQRQIGTLFSHLDSLITLHQRKLDALKKIKSALLEKMFPKDGSNIPEIRFTGFTEAWEQRKAIDLFKDVSEKGFDNLPVLSATQDRGMVYRDENGINISHDKKNELTYKHVIPGQFVIHLRSFQGGFAHSAIEGITSPAYTVFKFSNESQHDDIFWKYIFMSERFIKSLETVTYGIRDGRSISYSEFLGLPFAVPEKEEESCIGHFLKKYDSLITLHQRKLDALKKIKSALLEKMFV